MSADLMIWNDGDDAAPILVDIEARLQGSPSMFSPLPPDELEHLIKSVNLDVIEDQRAADRVEFRNTIVLAAIDPFRNEVVGAPLIVEGRDISATGVSFFHSRPLSQSFLVAGFRNVQGKLQSVLLELIWTQRRSDGRYHTGACFKQRLDEVPSVLKNSHRADMSIREGVRHE